MKVIFAVSLFASAISLVSAQLVTTTNGEAGELCGLHHLCLSNSTCVKAKGNYHCACPDPLVGNGKLGCVDEKSGTMFIQSDPHYKNLYHQFVSVSTPCRHRVMEYLYRDIFARVYLDGYLYKGGRFYVNRVEVRTAVTNVSMDSQIWYSALIEGNTTSEGHFEFKEWRKIGYSSNWTTPSLAPDTSVIVTEYDNVNNLAIFKIAKVGLTVSFRPVDPFVLEKSQPVPQVPGVVITVDKDFMEETQFSEIDLASTPNGPSLNTIAQALQMPLNMFAIFLTLNNNGEMEIDSNCPTCDETNRKYKDLCADTKYQTQGTNVCGQIYVDRELTSCIYDRYLSEMFLPHIFGDCVKAICGTSKSQCEILKQHIRGIHCPMPKALEDLDCNSLGSSPAHDDMLHDSFTNDNDTSH